MCLLAHAEAPAERGGPAVARVELGAHAVQADAAEGDVEHRARRLHHVPLPDEVRMQRPSDLAGRVGGARDREVDVADHAARVARALDRELPEVALGIQHERLRPCGELVRDLPASPRLVRQVAADVRARLVGVDVVDVAGGHGPQHEPRRPQRRRELVRQPCPMGHSGRPAAGSSQ